MPDEDQSDAGSGGASAPPPVAKRLRLSLLKKADAYQTPARTGKAEGPGGSARKQDRSARKQGRSARKQDRSARTRDRSAPARLKKTKSLLNCGDNLDGTRREGSNWASPVQTSISEKMLLAHAKGERKVLGDILVRAIVLADLLLDAGMRSLIQQFPRVYAYIGADCSPAGAQHLGMAQADAWRLSERLAGAAHW